MQDQLQDNRKIKNSSRPQHPIKHLQSSRMHKTQQGPHAVSTKRKKLMTPITIMDKNSSSSRWLKKRKRSHLSQLSTRLPSCWLGRTRIQMARQSAPTAEASATRIMARRRTWSTTRRASQPTSLKCATMKYSCNRDGLAAGLTSISGIRCAPAVSAISTRYPSGSLKWTNLRSKPWKGFIGTFRQALWTLSQTQKRQASLKIRINRKNRHAAVKR